jgi:hypothetical protein
VDESDQRGDGHGALEVERQEDRDEHQEHRERDECLPGDLAAPGPADVGDADR